MKVGGKNYHFPAQPEIKTIMHHALSVVEMQPRVPAWHLLKAGSAGSAGLGRIEPDWGGLSRIGADLPDWGGLERIEPDWAGYAGLGP